MLAREEGRDGGRREVEAFVVEVHLTEYQHAVVLQFEISWGAPQWLRYGSFRVMSGMSASSSISAQQVFLRSKPCFAQVALMTFFPLL